MGRTKREKRRRCFRVEKGLGPCVNTTRSEKGDLIRGKAFSGTSANQGNTEEHPRKSANKERSGTIALYRRAETEFADKSVVRTMEKKRGYVGNTGQEALAKKPGPLHDCLQWNIHKFQVEVNWSKQWGGTRKNQIEGRNYECLNPSRGAGQRSLNCDEEKWERRKDSAAKKGDPKKLARPKGGGRRGIQRWEGNQKHPTVIYIPRRGRGWRTSATTVHDELRG